MTLSAGMEGIVPFGYEVQQEINQDEEHAGTNLAVGRGARAPYHNDVFMPWILTVDASIVNRYFSATMYLEGPLDNAHGFTVSRVLLVTDEGLDS